jgi:Zn finger protein HypA/HybF involved in hydrogenase expression
MEINKAHWSMEKDHIRLSMPINKVDKERRIVTGFATLDNLDRQGDVVPKEASLRAFESFRGNIREMHQPIAVGKVVSFKEDTYFDPESKKFYNGIVVSAYVSKGAQDTWEKVLDGTLTGFSIGGEIHDAEKVYDENLDKTYQVIKEYSLSELSLVDNPANQFANVFSIEKGVASGYLSKTSTENVFWCRKCDIVKMSAESMCSCPQCDESMTNIGFVESNDTEKAMVVKSMIAEIKKSEIQNGIEEGSYIKYDGGYGRVSQIIFHGGARLSSQEVAIMAKSDDPVAVIKTYSQNDGTIVPTNRRVIKNISSLEKVNAISKSEVKEVSKMDSDIVIVDEIEKSMSEEIIEPAVQDAIPVVESDATVATEKAAADEMDDTEDTAAVEENPVADAAEDAAEDEMDDEAKKAEEPEITKADNSEEVTKSISEISETLTSALTTLAETVKALDAKIEGITKSVAGLSTEVNEVKDSFGKRVDAVEKDTAFRKSADLGEILQEEPVMEKSMTSTWGGRFLTNADLF